MEISCSLYAGDMRSSVVYYRNYICAAGIIINADIGAESVSLL